MNPEQKDISEIEIRDTFDCISTYVKSINNLLDIAYSEMTIADGAYGTKEALFHLIRKRLDKISLSITNITKDNQ